jgi:predicted lipid-binding transport protein (Tim44 family)
MDGFQFVDIIIFALLAGFIILRLRGVLGRRTGQERRPFSPLSKRQAPSGDDNVVPLPDRTTPPPAQDEPFDDEAPAESAVAQEEGSGDESGLAEGLRGLKQIDPAFDTESFLSGARIAYEMIVVSFANGDTDTLKPLLDPKVYDSFAGSIAEREARNETLETTLVAITSADIVEAELAKRLAKLTVKFVSEVVNVTRGSEGEIVAGDPRTIDKVTDLWTFARDAGGDDPNWKLISTRSPE